MRLIKIFFLFVPIYLTAQGGFHSRFTLPGSLTNVSKAVFEVSPGTYFSTGIVYDTANGTAFNRLAIMGLDANGKLQWTKKYGNADFEYLDNNFTFRSFYKLNNFFYHTTCIRDSNNQVAGVFIKFDANGDTIWQKTYRDPNQDVIPQMLTASVDGGFLLTGFFQDWVNHTRTCLVIKTDASGNELWRKAIHKIAPDTQDGKAIVQDPVSKKIAIVGYQYIGNASSWDTFDNLLILDSLGTKISQHAYSTSILFDIIRTNDNKFVAIGTNNYDGSLPQSYSTVFKFDINAPSQSIWRISYFGKLTSINSFSCLKELPNGDLLIAGTYDTTKAVTGITQALSRFTKIDAANGSVLSNRFYNYAPTGNSPNDLAPTSLELTSDGGWMASYRVVNNPAPNPFLFVKYDSTGCDTTEEWCRSVILEIPGHNKQDLKFEMFPNPAKDAVLVKFHVPGYKTGTLSIHNISGQELKRLSISEPTEQIIDISKYSPGIYFIALYYEDNLVETKKLIVE